MWLGDVLLAEHIGAKVDSADRARTCSNNALHSGSRNLAGNSPLLDRLLRDAASSSEGALTSGFLDCLVQGFARRHDLHSKKNL